VTLVGTRAWRLVLLALPILLGGEPAAGQAAITWDDCDVPVESPRLECAAIEMPLDHSRIDGRTMTIGLRRVRGGGDGARQLWYLAGGPGDPVGGALGRLAALFGDSGLDMYGIDHRGTGASGDLRCPDQEEASSPDGTEIARDEWPKCVAHIVETRPDLDLLTVTQSAMDLGRAIDAVAADAVRSGGPRPRVFVFGASYGSFWANRYLHLFPEQPAGVILDGIVPADWSFAEFDGSLDAVARAWLAHCGRDPVCGEHLGADPARAVEEVLTRLDGGHCPALGVDAATARILMGVVLMVDGIPNAAIPALAFRWGRCAWHDQMAVLQFFRSVVGGVGEAPTHSPVLQRHVALSEIWNPGDPSADALSAALRETIATTEVSASFAATYPDWPRYPVDPLDGAPAPFDGPMLMLHGGLDPTMPATRLSDLQARYGAEHQTFILIPEAGHVTLNFSTCARSLYAAFLADPEQAIDAECTGEESFVEFDADEETAAALFGRSDLWGDEVGVAETLWFRLRYNLTPILVLGLGFALLFRSGSPGTSLDRRAIVAVGLSIAIAFGAYVLVASVPLLLDYRGVSAHVAVMAISVVQLLLVGAVGLWLARRPARSAA
jgi:alpha-beta hydrolase superfamily lysophospholipase